MKKASIIFLALGLSGCGGAGSGTERPLDTEAVEAATNEPLELSNVRTPLSIGDTGADVYEVHKYFMRYGYFENPVLEERHPNWRPVVGAMPSDLEFFGPELELAVMTLQERIGLDPTGTIDDATLEHLGEERCQHPDGYTSRDTEKWHLLDERTDLSITYRFGTGFDGSDQTDDMKAAIESAMQTLKDRTLLSFTEVSSSPDLTFKAIDLEHTDYKGSAGSNYITFNLAYPYGDATDDDVVDTESVALHELGHFIGLAHSSFSYDPLLPNNPLTGEPLSGSGVPVMWYRLDPGAARRKLTVDDWSALLASTYTSWKQQTQRLRHVAFDAKGNGWGISNVRSGDYYGILYRAAGESSWSEVSGAANQVAVQADGTAWVITSTGGIYRRTGVTSANPKGTGWQGMPGRAVDIAAGGGSVFVLGNVLNAHGNYDVYSWNGSDWNLTSASGFKGGLNLAVSPSGIPYVSDTEYKVRAVVNAGIRTYPGSARDIAMGSKGGLWMLGQSQDEDGNSYAYIWNEQPFMPYGGPNPVAQKDWVKVSGQRFKSIAVDHQGTPWGIRHSAYAYERTD